ncbi:hypothetical protein K435DRAFT_794499 [Dendrothele bispora CBS 962.96]|uniref:Uncharacterized protein n=1 Tax=Dendrothele bispora (strain CBS 962.96) TaxID=1314807 RepID=A0A4S8MC12_DENBC|nr:hypothetical protein K435DRAFT_794499 [Dendrothele bispora CBS 962.96]
MDNVEKFPARQFVSGGLITAIRVKKQISQLIEDNTISKTLILQKSDRMIEKSVKGGGVSRSLESSINHGNVALTSIALRIERYVSKNKSANVAGSGNKSENEISASSATSEHFYV